MPSAAVSQRRCQGSHQARAPAARHLPLSFSRSMEVRRYYFETEAFLCQVRSISQAIAVSVLSAPEGECTLSCVWVTVPNLDVLVSVSEEILEPRTAKFNWALLSRFFPAVTDRKSTRLNSSH